MASATKILFGTGKNRPPEEIDLIDVAFVILIPAAASFLFEVFSLQVNVFGGYNVTEAIWTFSNLDISLAFLIAVFGAFWIILTNFINGDTEQMEGEIALIALAIVLPIAYEMIPAVNDLIMSHDMIQVGAWLYVSIAVVIVSYIG